ncbi:MAG: AMP-binding protein, partial [Dehalococcoidia bacterium]
MVTQQPAARDRGEPLNLARACIEPWATDPAHAARPAFTFVSDAGDRTWTFAEVQAVIERVARGFVAAGLRPGDRVLVRLPHSPEYAFAFLGATLA